MLLMASCLTMLFGCGNRGRETVTNRNIPIEDITAFYFTVENVNFDAFYQRYRFYVDNGAYLFDHETRERPGDYGPTTEADVTEALEMKGAMAQKEREKAKKEVMEWLKKLGYVK